jgi:hypothetical protein
VGKIYVAAVIVMMTIIMPPAPTTKIAGEFDVCVLKENLPALMTCVKT